MSYNSILKAYLKALQEQYKNATNSRQYTAELSYRMPLDTMERALAKEFNPDDDIDVILEPTTQGRVGRPDWRIHNKDTMGIYGYIEGKGLSEEPFDTRPYAAQIKKYLTAQRIRWITRFPYMLRPKNQMSCWRILTESCMVFRLQDFVSLQCMDPWEDRTWRISDLRIRW